MVLNCRFQEAYSAFFGGEDTVENSSREFVSTRLISVLSNKIYKVSFYICLAEISTKAIDKIGVHFSNDSLYYNTIENIPVRPQILNSNGILRDTMNWMLFEENYQAQGGERYIIIGNFYNNYTTNFEVVKPDPVERSPYYYIDDVSITEYINDTSLINEITLSPNPATGNFSLNYSLQEYETGIFNLYNDLGQLVKQVVLSQQKGIVPIEIAEHAAGMYFWNVVSSNNRIGRGKLVKSN